MNFNSPVWLLALIPVALLLLAYLVLQLRRKKYVAKFSNLQLLGSVAPKRPGWRRHLTFVLLVGGLAVLALGVAEPTADVRVPRDNATVILAIDVSLSMEATDVLPNRLEAAKTAAKTFVGLLPKRINLGVVSFAGTASLLVPPTLDRTAATRAVEGLQLRESTAIGEAIFTGLDAIAAFNQQTASEGGEPPPARIVLLSDGTNTVGREPLPEGARRGLHDRVRDGLRDGHEPGRDDPCPVGQADPRGDRGEDRWDVPHRDLGRGAEEGLRQHRLADRVHDAEQDHQLAVHGGRPAGAARSGRLVPALGRPAHLALAAGSPGVGGTAAP
jgi:hypothetical protein